MTLPACHLCGADALVEIEGFAALPRVASDCRPFPAGGRLAECMSCGAIVKPVDEAFRREAAEIYAGYDLYHQSAGGAEQSVFDRETGAALPRSRRILDFARSHAALAGDGTLIDVGSGTGAMLRAASSALGGWHLIAVEPHPADEGALAGIAGVETVLPSLDGQAGTADLVTIIHALEHAADPVALLAAARGALKPGGALLIEVPYFPDNPFDLVIADHCTHFTRATLAAVLARAGLAPVATASDWVAKEITVVARAGSTAVAAPHEDAGGDARRFRVWLDDVLGVAAEASAADTFGLFGTAIAANWLLGPCDRRVRLFVDEDPNRAGRSYRGRPLHHPRDVPADAVVFMPLPPALARSIRSRIDDGRVDYLLPPPLPPRAH